VGVQEHICALLGKLAHRHGYGTTISKEALVRLAVPPADQGAAREAFEELRDLPGVHDGGQVGVAIDSSNQGEVIQYLYDNCDGWDEFSLRTRFKHFEGWDNLDFS
jgi:hypothetical protein